VRGKAGKLSIALVVIAVVLTASAVAAVKKITASGTLVFAGAADPTYLDPALVSDGESFRVTKQIYEGLVQLKPGTLKVAPALATSWGVAKDGKTWTFQLRKGVKFHDGTPFNAAAVCFNFNRWYNFTGPFQDATATNYWRTVFGGFHHNEAANASLGQSLYQSCRAKGKYTALIKLTRRSGPFVPSLVIGSFAMQSPAALKKWDADKGELRNGTFYPTGTYAFSHPTGTGPYKFKQWVVGQKVVLVRNAQYWGKKPGISTLIIQPIADSTARLQALQKGDVNGYDLVNTPDIPTIKDSSSLKLVDRPQFNVGYVTINSAHAPFNNVKVRQAVAYGLNRTAVVKTLYAGRGVVAQEFMPPTIPFGYAKNVQKYPYNPAKAKAMLKAAGLTLPVKVDFWYPTGISRPYMPNPKLNFEVFSDSLEKSGFQVEAHSAPWRPDYVKHVNDGTAGDLNLVGWTGDFGDPDNFIGNFFQTPTPQFGLNNAKLRNLLTRAESSVSEKVRDKLYKQANVMVMKLVPGVPYVHTKPALGFQKRVKGYVASPVGTEPFSTVSIGGQ
jgi:peptide/nickel transport system substrate-binding protein